MLSYHSHSVPFPRLRRRDTTRWLRAVAASHGYTIGELGYVFCNDEKILEVNRQYLGHDYYTDIITFDYTEGKVINGDIYISIDTVRSNAVQQRVDFDEELHRVIVHGVLHLCGIDDKGPGQRAVMEAAENKALRLYFSA
ncbi:MAG: rRNA maturation RNase YbeY [Bacteroidaceae bacterium]|nr:rRNA maturation RNase YbeY [Bacteroidaceae bacterium]